MGGPAPPTVGPEEFTVRRLVTRPWMLVLLRARSRWDLRRAGFRSRYRYYGGVVAFAVGIAGCAGTPLALTAGVVTGAIGLLLSALLLVPDWIATRRAPVTIEPVTRPATTIVPGAGGRLVRHPGSLRELAVVWDAIDAVLPRSTAGVSWQPRAETLPPRLARHRPAVLAARATATSYDGALVRQGADLTPDGLAGGGPIPLGRTTYFNLICSNYLSNSRIVDRATGSVLVDGAELIRDRAGGLEPLERSGLANGIGISTVAFTADGRLVVPWQDGRSMSSAGLIAPSGSGSVEPPDLGGTTGWRRRPVAAEGTLLREVVRRAMERELVEECHIGYADIEWTEVLGYFRWVTKGAKPEYVGVTRLRLRADQFAGLDVRIEETPYVQRLSFDVEVSFDKLRDHPETLRCLPAGRLREIASMPLFMCLRALGRDLRRPDDVGERLRALASG